MDREDLVEGDIVELYFDLQKQKVVHQEQSDSLITGTVLFSEDALTPLISWKKDEGKPRDVIDISDPDERLSNPNACKKLTEKGYQYGMYYATTMIARVISRGPIQETPKVADMSVIETIPEVNNTFDFDAYNSLDYLYSCRT